MTTRSLDPMARDHLVKLLGLLGSAHDGERAAAGLKADHFLKRLGLSWSDVICLPAAGQADEPPWLVIVRRCLAAGVAGNAVEREFLHSMLGWAGQPTEKQLAWIERIHRRVA